MTNEVCKGCKYCGSAYAQDGFKFLTCKFPPYKGKWIAEIPDCPKLLKGVQAERIRLIELIHQAGDAAQNAPLIDFTATLADYLLENGVIVPPVKVGDTVWDNDFGYSKGYTVTGFDIGKTMDDDVEHRELFVYYQNWNGSITCSAPVSIFGKTVFLTQEEAEKALKENT